MDNPEWHRFHSEVEDFCKDHVVRLIDTQWRTNESVEQFAARIIQEQTILATVRAIMCIPSHAVATLYELEAKQGGLKVNAR